MLNDTVFFIVTTLILFVIRFLFSSFRNTKIIKTYNTLIHIILYSNHSLHYFIPLFHIILHSFISPVSINHNRKHNLNHCNPLSSPSPGVLFTESVGTPNLVGILMQRLSTVVLPFFTLLVFI
jgi:hypothetical protein